MLPCLVCGRLSRQSRCWRHRRRQARGYTQDYMDERLRRLSVPARCVDCGHLALAGGRCGDPSCKRCPLQLDHVIPLARLRKMPGVKPIYAVRCRKCNRAKSDH